MANLWRLIKAVFQPKPDNKVEVEAEVPKPTLDNPKEITIMAKPMHTGKMPAALAKYHQQKGVPKAAKKSAPKPAGKK